MKEFNDVINIIKEDNVEGLEFIYKEKNLSKFFYKNYEKIFNKVLENNSLKCLYWLMNQSSVKEFKSVLFSEIEYESWTKQTQEMFVFLLDYSIENKLKIYKACFIMIL